MSALEQYLQEHNIEPFRLSMESGVRYVTIWNAVRAKPIFYSNAQKIRATLHRLTGLAYTGPIPTIDDPPIEQLPTIPIKRLKQDKNDKGGFSSRESL